VHLVGGGAQAPHRVDRSRNDAVSYAAAAGMGNTHDPGPVVGEDDGYAIRDQHTQRQARSLGSQRVYVSDGSCAWRIDDCGISTMDLAHPHHTVRRNAKTVTQDLPVVLDRGRVVADMVAEIE
jgi:hypothetical protein